MNLRLGLRDAVLAEFPMFWYSLLLYVGEAHRTRKQRWVSHDCHSYIGNYIELHRRYSLDVAVGIAFWYGAPTNRKQRLQLLEDAPFPRMQRFGTHG